MTQSEPARPRGVPQPRLRSVVLSLLLTATLLGADSIGFVGTGAIGGTSGTPPTTIGAAQAGVITAKAKSKKSSKKKSAKKPAKVTKVSLSPKGVARESIRMRWAWRSGVAKYELQASTNSKFSKPVRLVVNAARTRPAGGMQTARVHKLKNATKYRLRIRAINANGKKGAWSKTVKTATNVYQPGKIAKVTAKAGKAPKTVKFTWKQSVRKYTDYFVLDIARTSFSPSTKGRDHQRIIIPASKSSYTLSAARAAKSGAIKGSGNHLFYRFRAVRKGNAGKATRHYSGTYAVLPASEAPAKKGTDLHVASYNVASAAATSKLPGRTWSDRRTKVASTILGSKAGIIGLQELVSGNAVDGGSIKAGQLARQTQDLLDVVRSQARTTRPGSDFRLVRVSSYDPPGAVNGSTGARILYDRSLYTLLSKCSETTNNSSYSDSCTILMPTLSGDSLRHERRAAYARFADKKTGQKFWVVSAHLDHRADTPATKLRFEKLRQKQGRALAKALDRLAGDEPVIFAADLNSRPTNPLTPSLVQRELLTAGYYDASDTPKRSNTKYPTYTNWTTKAKPNVAGFGARVDFILVKGARGSVSYKVHTVVKDTKRASDHSLISAHLRLP